MEDNPANGPSESLSLVRIDSYRDPEERSRDGKSGEITYFLTYHRKNGEKTIKAKAVEIGELKHCGHRDLQPLSEEGYTHYGIFRAEDRSTTTLVQHENGSVFKVFSFSQSDVNVSHPVSISMDADE